MPVAKLDTKQELADASVFDIKNSPPTCPMCLDTFSFRYQLEWHFQWKHQSEGKLLLCNECNEAFTEQTDFKSHLTEVHRSLNVLNACEKCGLRFKTDLELRQHHLTHKNERPYTCKNCFRSFAKKNAFEQHLLTHVGRKVPELHKCRGCFNRRSFSLNHSKNRISECRYIACMTERVCVHGTVRTLSL